MEPIPDADSLPAMLLDHDQWVCWRAQRRGSKQTKVPVNPHTGRFASATDGDTWGAFADAMKYAQDGSADGLGFVFTDDDPLVGVDLDDCRVPETGTLTDDAADIVDRLDSYTEISPSGTGVHVLVEATLPEGGNRKGDVECYETARFFTVTGDHVDETPASIETRPDAVTRVHELYVQSETASPEHASAELRQADSPGVGRKRPGKETDTVDENGLSDEAIIERAHDAANGEKFARLWRGDTSGYESHSEADMALCALLAFWTGGDPAQLDRLFRESGLMREKWAKQHYADGSTYGAKTIERVLAGTDEFYDPDQATATSEPESQAQKEAGESGEEDADVHVLRRRLTELEAREDQHLSIISELQSEVERLETANAHLAADLSEERTPRSHASSGAEGTPSFWTRLVSLLR